MSEFSGRGWYAPLQWIAALFLFFFFNDTATTEIYTLSLHDALPISVADGLALDEQRAADANERGPGQRSEEHTSELQSQSNLVCRLLLEKKKREAPNREWAGPRPKLPAQPPR